MFLEPRPIDLAEILPHTIRCTSDQVQFAGLRAVVRELPATGKLYLPVGTSHFWLAFRPVEAPQRMEVEFKDTQERFFVDRSLQFFSPGRRLTTQWRGAEGVVTHFHFRTEFLHVVAASAGVSQKLLEQRSWQEVALEEPLEALCRLLMREVQAGCLRGAGYFEGLSQALAFALVRRLACAQSARLDRRIEYAVRLLEQRYLEKVSIKEVARAAGLSRHQFFRKFRGSVGLSPHAFLVQCRLRHARRLLAVGAGHLSLADVAAEAGFSDQTHLTRHFRREFGQTPGHWSRSQQIAEKPSTNGLYERASAELQCQRLGHAPVQV
jgi:AraC-like DNA-binding protein